MLFLTIFCTVLLGVRMIGALSKSICKKYEKPAIILGEMIGTCLWVATITTTLWLLYIKIPNA